MKELVKQLGWNDDRSVIALGMFELTDEERVICKQAINVWHESKEIVPSSDLDNVEVWELLKRGCHTILIYLQMEESVIGGDTVAMMRKRTIASQIITIWWYINKKHPWAFAEWFSQTGREIRAVSNMLRLML